MRHLAALACLACLAWLVACGASPALADEGARYAPATRGGRPWVAEILEERAAAHDVRAGLMTRMAVCESGPTLNPRAVGAAGEIGLLQLHPAGLLPLFYRLGYDDPWSVWQQADFTAWALAHGLASHWSCWRAVR